VSFPIAVNEMLSHLDSLLTVVSIPTGNVNKLPDDVVVLRSATKLKTGIGKISEEDPVANKIIEQGQFNATVDSVLWANESANVVDRSRELISQFLSMNNITTTHGLFKNLSITNATGPDYLEHAKWWRVSVGINLTFEYRFEEVPGTGVIQEIPVSLEGELEEEFTVS